MYLGIKSSIRAAVASDNSEGLITQQFPMKKGEEGEEGCEIAA